MKGFRKRLKYQISWQNRPVGAELFHAGTDGQTDMTKVIAPENCFVIEDDYSCKKNNKRRKFSVKYVQMSNSVSNKISVYTL